MEYKIYGLTEPHGPMKHIYIGFTTQDLKERLRNHIRRDENNYKCGWIKSLKKTNQLPRIFLIKLTDAQNWAKDERDEIEKWRLTQQATGIKVLNLTDGGEGTLGHKHSAKTRELFSKQRKGKPGHLQSKETREKMSKAAAGNQNGKGWKPTVEWRQAMEKMRGAGHWAYGTHVSDDVKKKKSLKQKKLTDEQILQVKKMVKDGVPQNKVAKIFGVGHGTVGRIVHDQLAYLNRWPSDKLQKG